MTPSSQLTRQQSPARWCIRQTFATRFVEARRAQPYKLPPVHSLQLRKWYGDQVMPDFHRFMKARMLMGAFRYGPFAEQEGYEYTTYAKELIDRYSDTLNSEFLIDASNLCGIEFSRHPERFTPTDDGEHHQKG